MVDIHSHIIYGIDDGAQDENTTLEMLRIAERSGTKKIVATPHYIKGRFICEYGDVVLKVEELKKLALKNQIDIEIFAGQEVYYDDQLIYYYNDKLIGTINESRYMLIELPMIEFDLNDIIDNLYELKLKGIVPIIAHPERYKPFMKQPSLINKLIKEGYLFQMNAGSLLGKFGKEAKKLADTYYKSGIYSVIGSDAHSCNRRSTSMEEIKEYLADDILIFEDNAEKILNNEEVKFNGSLIKEKRKIFGIFSR